MTQLNVRELELKNDATLWKRMSTNVPACDGMKGALPETARLALEPMKMTRMALKAVASLKNRFLAKRTYTMRTTYTTTDRTPTCSVLEGEKELYSTASNFASKEDAFAAARALVDEQLDGHRVTKPTNDLRRRNG